VKDGRRWEVRRVVRWRVVLRESDESWAKARRGGMVKTRKKETRAMNNDRMNKRRLDEERAVDAMYFNGVDEWTKRWRSDRDESELIARLGWRLENRGEMKSEDCEGVGGVRSEANEWPVSWREDGLDWAFQLGDWKKKGFAVCWRKATDSNKRLERRRRTRRGRQRARASEKTVSKTDESKRWEEGERGEGVTWVEVLLRSDVMLSCQVMITVVVVLLNSHH
jgi:hypothetical protein